MTYALQNNVLNDENTAACYHWSIESVLEGKFRPHGSYGINHTKHNLEYGHLIVGLMQSSSKRTTLQRERNHDKTNGQGIRMICVKKGQLEYRIPMKKDMKDMEDEEYVKWMFMLGEYYRGLRN
jgi:hypothetical protein